MKIRFDREGGEMINAYVLDIEESTVRPNLEITHGFHAGLNPALSTARGNFASFDLAFIEAASWLVHFGHQLINYFQAKRPVAG